MFVNFVQSNLTSFLIFLILKFSSRIQSNLSEDKQQNCSLKHENDENLSNTDKNKTKENNIFDFFPRASMVKEPNLDGEFLNFF